MLTWIQTESIGIYCFFSFAFATMLLIDILADQRRKSARGSVDPQFSVTFGIILKVIARQMIFCDKTLPSMFE